MVHSFSCTLRLATLRPALPFLSSLVEGRDICMPSSLAWGRRGATKTMLPFLQIRPKHIVIHPQPSLSSLPKSPHLPFATTVRCRNGPQCFLLHTLPGLTGGHA
ncbi:uncharacterized protein BDZ83DRAFT_18150 [Colletotrichum acutatum]|uniref:Uncharacterized protein n=1 Tax=Glomerella acutata TaxID=27357 RepID=A0AAD8XDZ7_GLOAC|nr:uncharacterized protein BDZ83DRAFT_18150 [Colletotrichum acutatum]KAK1718783.1 hypothetical protein BDZ83DRAFT_18150 [Colletotrichum acutatum]